MGRVNGQARVEYRDASGPVTRQVIHFAAAPGDSQTDWRTENIRGINDLTRLMDDANKAKKLTLIVRMDGVVAFAPNRSIDFLSIQFNDASSGGKLAIFSAKDLTVVKSLPVTKELLPAVQRAVNHPIAGVEVGKAQIVSLQVSQPFTRVP